MSDSADRRDLQVEDTLDLAFDLPQEFEDDPYLSSLYREIIARLRVEANGLPMNTVQTLLLERIAFFYINLKRSERSEALSPTRHKDLVSFWLNMTSEFNKQLAAGHEQLRDALLLSISKMVMSKIDEIEDQETRQQLRILLSEGFAEMGL
jgi:ribulose bisphosphate carboxylase small subunit